LGGLVLCLHADVNRVVGSRHDETDSNMIHITQKMAFYVVAALTIMCELLTGTYYAQVMITL
jgi:hypothetical protein